MTHPLTDDIIESEIATPSHFIIGSLVGMFKHDDIRTAADWQLEQVIEWGYKHLYPDQINALVQAMRPQEDTP